MTLTTTPALRLLPPLAVAVAFAIPALLLAPPAVTPEPPAPPLTQLAQPPIDEVFAPAYGDLMGCLVEWNERVAGDTALRVALRVSIDGFGYGATTMDGPESPALRLCVASALARVSFIGGPVELELEVSVTWRQRVLGVSHRITGTRGPPHVDDDSALHHGATMVY